MKKIYITGIAGLLGSNLAQELKGKYEITGVDMVREGIGEVQYNVFDMSDYARLREDIENQKPDVLIHTVAVVNVDKCEVEKELAEHINADLTRKVADVCVENHIKMIYISTDAVFDGTLSRMYEETDKVHPINEYAKTKYRGEIFTAKCENNLILRTNIYGLNIQQKKSFGEWIVEALKNDEELNMFEDIYFSPILVNELAEVIDKCIEKDLNGVYHACGTGMINKYEFGLKVKEIFGIKTGKIHCSSSESMHFTAQRPKNMGMSNKKICDELNIRIRTPEESIIKFYELYCRRLGDGLRGN